jgi:hypothetical protein
MKRFSEADIGEEFGPIEIQIGDDAIRRIKAVDDENFWLNEGTETKSVIDPAILVQYSNVLKTTKYSLEGLVHVNQKIRIHKAVRVGDKFTMTGKVTSKYTSRTGKIFLEFECIFMDEGDNVVLESKETYLLKL